MQACSGRLGLEFEHTPELIPTLQVWTINMTLSLHFNYVGGQDNNSLQKIPGKGKYSLVQLKRKGQGHYIWQDQHVFSAFTENVLGRGWGGPTNAATMSRDCKL